jgi:hypothetical protein
MFRRLLPLHSSVMTKTVFGLLCLFALSGCGGGGSGAAVGESSVSTDPTQQQSQMGTATLGTARLQ